MNPPPRRRPNGPAAKAPAVPAVPATAGSPAGPAGEAGRFDGGPEVAGDRHPPDLHGSTSARPRAEELVKWSTAATGVFVVAAALSAAVPEPLVVLGVAVSVVLFVAGSVAFLTGYARALQRSRTQTVDFPGLFFLAGSVAPALRRRLLLLLAVQVVVGLAAAAIRPFTPLAFCTLAPVFGLGWLTLAGATHGWFPPRQR